MLRKIVLSFFVSVFFFLFFIPQEACATNYYVAGDIGNDTTGDGSSDNPWKTIQKAADTVSAGDTVNVKGDITYSETTACAFFTAIVCLSVAGTENNSITYQSWFGTGIPIIDGDSTSKGFSFNFVTSTDYIKISGFIVKDTTDAFYLSGQDIYITNNIIYDTTLTNNHYGIVAGLASESNDIRIYNNTIYQKDRGIHIDKGAAFIKNNIITNGNYGIGSNSGMYVSLDIDYNNVYNNSTSNFDLGFLYRPGHDLSVNPEFNNESVFDFTLKNNSSLIDAAEALDEVADDISATIRPQGNGFDLGAYESNFSQENPPNSTPSVLYSIPDKIMTLLATYIGEAPSSQFGMRNTYSSLLVGDINEDYYADVLVGGRHTVPNGGLYAFFGRSIPINTQAASADAIIRGNISGSRISDNVSLGDIDGDSKNELLITDYNAGKAFIFKTSSDFSSQTVSTAEGTITGPSHFGTGSSIIGDINGDGMEDYIIYSDTEKKVYLFYGGLITDKNYSSADVVYSVDADVYFTRSGDINNDGYKDIVMGCPNCNSYHGALHIFYGSQNLSDKSMSQADVTINGSNSGYYLGTWNALADVNGDGFSDILTVSSKNTYVFYGGLNLTNSTSNEANVILTADPAYPTNSSLGFALESGDINNDGYPDIITTNSSLPRTYIFFGSPNLSSKNASEADLVFDYIETERGYFGGPIATGDVNNDGYTEIAAGNGQYNQRQGKVWLFGPPHGSPTINLNTIGNTNNLVISGTASDTLAVGAVEVSTDNGSWDSCTLTSGSFSCALSSSLADGSHSLRLRSKNSHGVYMAAREYATATFTYDHTSPLVDWTDTSGNKKKYESGGSDNVYTTNSLPSFTFSKSNDSTSGIAKYQIVVNGDVYIDDINPDKPPDKDYRDEENKYISYSGDNISVSAKREQDKLGNGAYKWKVRAIDKAGNSTDTGEKILRINTHEANFSGNYFPISVLSIGGKNTTISSLHYDEVPAGISIFSHSPTFYGIAPVGTEISLKIEKDNGNNARESVVDTTATTNQSSRFGINLSGLDNDEYFINLSGVNPYGDYVEIPEFKLVIDTSSYPKETVEATPDEDQPDLQSDEPTPTPETTEKEDSPPTQDQKQKRCFLFFCW